MNLFQQVEVGPKIISSQWLYLCLLTASIPYFITFLQTGVKILFGSHPWPSIWTLIWVSRLCLLLFFIATGIGERRSYDLFRSYRKVLLTAIIYDTFSIMLTCR